jgi:hypothetical protein
LATEFLIFLNNKADENCDQCNDNKITITTTMAITTITTTSSSSGAVK